MFRLTEEEGCGAKRNVALWRKHLMMEIFGGLPGSQSSSIVTFARSVTANRPVVCFGRHRKSPRRKGRATPLLRHLPHRRLHTTYDSRHPRTTKI
jgi:hypothetical protein